MMDITDSALLFINPVTGIRPGPILIYTDILRNGIRMVQFESAEVLVILFNPWWVAVQSEVSQEPLLKFTNKSGTRTCSALY